MVPWFLSFSLVVLSFSVRIVWFCIGLGLFSYGLLLCTNMLVKVVHPEVFFGPAIPRLRGSPETFRTDLFFEKAAFFLGRFRP